MRVWKSKIIGFMIAICALCITVSLGSVQNVQAASKARYTIRKIQEKKTYKKSSATYSYELPQLKGKSAAVKKINKSLKSYYTKNLKLKKDLFKQFSDDKKAGYLDKKTEILFANTKCKETYNKDGYVRFVYYFTWHGCGTGNENGTAVIYRLKDGKKVEEIPASAADLKGLNLVKGIWYMTDSEQNKSKVEFSGKTIKYYCSDSSTVNWSAAIDEVIKTDYGYYFKVDFGLNIYIGYQLRLTDTNTLIYVGIGDPYSSEGLNKEASLSRN